MQLLIDNPAGAPVDTTSVDVAPQGSALEQRIADGTYTADAHALARSFLEYLEHLAGPG
jgi:anti-sigma28 factor (negative regulator of flagellin synthesis)